MIFRAKIDTPLGEMTAVADDGAILLLLFSDDSGLETKMAKVSKYRKIVDNATSNAIIISLQKELDDYFSGKLTIFTTPYYFDDSVFRQKAWKVLSLIPYGRTISYLEQASLLGSRSSVRAVANANSSNLISILIPCHRVIGLDGSLRGYSSGVWRKRWLLSHEGALIDDSSFM